MYYVKMMDAKHDGFEIIEVETLNYVKFSRVTEDSVYECIMNGYEDGNPIVTLHLNIDGSEPISFYPRGNTYVLNEQGKTIATFPQK